MAQWCQALSKGHEWHHLCPQGTHHLFDEKDYSHVIISTKLVAWTKHDRTILKHVFDLWFLPFYMAQVVIPSATFCSAPSPSSLTTDILAYRLNSNSQSRALSWSAWLPLRKSPWQLWSPAKTITYHPMTLSHIFNYLWISGLPT